MAALDVEENKEETFEQCAESKNQSEQNQDCKQWITHHSELHANLEEQNIT